MKYMVMVVGSQADYAAMGGEASKDGGPAWGKDDLQKMMDFMSRLNEELTASGELVDAQGLTDPKKARTVSRGEDGGTVVTEAPYDSADRRLAGFWILECSSYERVTEIAARVLDCPGPDGAPTPPVHIRPIDDGGPDV